MADVAQTQAQPEQRQGRGAFGGRREGGAEGERRGRGRGRGRGARSGEEGERRGRGRGGRGGRPQRGGQGDDDKDWVPLTKLGRLVKEGKIKTLEEIYEFSLPIKEYQIVDYFLKAKLKDEVMKISPVQKQTRAGQRTRFKAYVVIGDEDGHIGLGVKVASEVANAIRGAIIMAKLSLIPIRRGYWGNKIGAPHTTPIKVTGKSGSVSVRLIPAPRGSGLVAAPVPKRVLSLAGYEDVFTGSQGHTKTLGNFVKATFDAISKTYGFLTPELWKQAAFKKTPYHEYSSFLQTATNKKYYK